VIKEISIAGLEATRMAHAITILTEMAGGSPLTIDQCGGSKT
jgi:hypothetical protein